MATWSSTSALDEFLARILSGAAKSALDAGWATALTQSLNSAERAMYAILVGERGFSAADISLTAWPEGENYALSIAAYFFLTTYYVRQAKDNVPRDTVLDLDRRDELRVAPLINASNELIEPSGTAELVPSGGAMDDGEVVPASLTDDEYSGEGITALTETDDPED